MATWTNLWRGWFFLLVVYWVLGESMTRVKIFGQFSLSAAWVLLAFISGVFLVVLSFPKLNLPWINRRSWSWRTYRWLVGFWLLLLLEGGVLLVMNIFMGVPYSGDWLYPALQELTSWGLYGFSVLGAAILICPNLRRASRIATLLKLVFVVSLVFVVINPTRSLAAEVAVAGSAVTFLARPAYRWFLFFITAGVLAASGSRMAVLAFIAGHLFTYLFFLKLMKPRTWYPPFVLAAVMLASAPIFLRTQAGERSVELIQTVLEAGVEGVLETGEGAYLTQGRSIVWPAIVDHSFQRAFFGHGPGTASAYAYYVSQNSRFQHPHNEYLRVFHNYGLVGLLAFLGFYSAILVYARSSLGFVRKSGKQLWFHALVASTLTSLLLFATDNAGLYVFVMSIHGVLVGAALCLGAFCCAGVSRGL